VINTGARRGFEAELTRPRLEWVEDDHCPVDRVAEALEATDQVKRESIGRPRSDADGSRQPRVLQGRHALPNLIALVAGAVRVVQQQEVKAILAEALKTPLGRHAQVVRVFARAAQRSVGEAREALRALPLAFVEVVADRPDEAVVVARHAGQGVAEQRVGFTLPVGVGSEHGVNAVARLQESLQPLGLDLLTET
jgi:hypothetical protein